MGIPSNISQPSHARAASAPKRLRMGLRRGRSEPSSGRDSGTYPSARAAAPSAIRIRQTLRRSHFMATTYASTRSTLILSMSAQPTPSFAASSMWSTSFGFLPNSVAA